MHMNDLSPNTTTTRQTLAAAQADHAAASAFLNALLREWDGWYMLSLECARELGFDAPVALFPLMNGHDDLLVQLRHQGSFRQSILLPFYRLGEHATLEELPLVQVIAMLIADPGASPGEPHLQLQLLRRFLDSRAAIETAFDTVARHEDAELWSFQQAEQALLAGHPTHPNPRSRDEVDVDEAKLYAPELQGRFPLYWIAAHKSVLVLKSGSNIAADEFCREMAAADETLPASLTSDLPEDFLPIPWHPWQAPHLLKRADVLEWINAGKIRLIGPAGKPFAATGSMRGIHGWHAPYMLKFSLSMRLTNSRRVLSRKEVERGIQMYELLASDVGSRIADEQPTLNILREPAYVALKAPDGEALEESFVVFRDNPFRDENAPGPIMMASLCEETFNDPSPLSQLIGKIAGRSGKPAAEIASQWFDDFLRVAIEPLIQVRSTHGLLFGSHQQNMMIALKDGFPDQLWVRDCQGTGHLTTHHDALEKYVPDIGRYAENVAEPALGDALLCYYVIVNNLMNVIATLSIDGLNDEGSYYRQLKAFLEQSRERANGDTAFHDMLLTAPTLCSKGNYRTSLSGVNEAAGDASGQLAAFLQIPNPLSKLVTQP